MGRPSIAAWVPVVEMLANDHPLEARHHDHGLAASGGTTARLPREAGPAADLPEA